MEAAVVLPVYLCLCVVVLMFFHALSAQWAVQVSINEAVRNAALYGADSAGIAVGGIGKNDITITKDTSVPIPVGLFGRQAIRVSQQAKSRRWIGWDPHEFDGTDDEITVYVTEAGRVYHRSRGCTYLNPSIRSISLSAVPDARNRGGGRYNRCPLCGRNAGSTVYITTDGGAYHSSRTCSGLKRTIYTMKLREAREKYPPCSKCGN